jgi:hypothetical protein
MKVKNLRETVHVFVCDPEIVLRHPISGQDFFLQSIITLMKERDFKVLIVHPRNIKSLSNRISSDERDLYLHMHYVRLDDIILSKILFPKSMRLLYVYQLDDPTWSCYGKYRHSAFLHLTAILKLIDYYVTPSCDLSKELSLIVGPNNVKTLEPYYPCDETFNNFLVNEKAKDLEEKYLNVLYIGRINKYRIDLALTINALKALANKGFNVRFQIISMKEMGLSTQYKIFNSGKLRVELIGKRLTEDQKAEIYAQSHILLFITKGYPAMRPPLSIIESICYGVIPIISPNITEFMHINDIVVKNLESKALVESIEHITSMFRIISKKVFISFKHFYCKERFFQQLLSILK